MNLSTKFAIAVTALTAFIVGGVTLVNVQREQRMIVQEIERKGTILADTLAMASVNAFMSYDYSTLKRFLEAATRDPGIIYAMVLDSTGVIKMHTDLREIGRYVSDEISARALDTDEVLVQRLPEQLGGLVYDVAAPIVAAGRRVGVLRLGLSTHGIQTALQRSRTEVALIGLAALVLGIGGAIVMTKRISRPLRELVTGARAVARGDLTWRARVGARDEVGEVAAAFGFMTESLQSHIEERVRSERLVILGTMAAGIAHEVRNPLEAIKGAAQVIEGCGDDSTVHKFTGIIKDEVTELDRFLEGFLRFARPAPLLLESLNVNGLVEETLALLEPLCGDHGVTLTRELAGSLSPVTADAHQIKQVLMNLCLNAIQAMPDGGILTVVTRPMVVDGQDGMELLVRDTGSGMVESIRHKVFEPFVTTKEGGSGLGLAVSKSIVERHGGRIWLTTDEISGTTFTVWLPIAGGGMEIAKSSV
ncbi:MAG: ATP-binding protein [bacterium]|nr:HAMP domain-containing protein [bacterium]